MAMAGILLIYRSSVIPGTERFRWSSGPGVPARVCECTVGRLVHSPMAPQVHD
jgi:hypothetical protein